MLKAWRVIGMDELPPSSTEFDPTAYVLTQAPDLAPQCEIWERELLGFDETPPRGYEPVCAAREPLGADAAFLALDAAYDAGIESTQVFVDWLHEADVPACEARMHVAAWRSTHPDPWIYTHDIGLEANRELECA